MNCFPGTLSNTGTVYQHTFNTSGSYSYICFAHCFLGMAGVVNVLDDLAKTLPAAKTAKPEQFVDMRFLENLEKSGLLKELYP